MYNKLLVINDCPEYNMGHTFIMNSFISFFTGQKRLYFERDFLM